MNLAASVAAAPAGLRQRIEGSARAHQHFILIVAVFLTFRVLLPFGLTSAGPDIDDYLRWGALADSGLYPYVHYWSEYPPLFSWSVLMLYRLSTLVPTAPADPQFWFGLALRMTMALFDLGSLILVYATALQLGSRARAVRTAALFAAGFITAYAAMGWYDAVPLFFLLLAFYLALRDRMTASAVAAAIGAMIKITPILMAPVALRRMTGVRRRWSYLLTVAITALALLLPFLIVGTPYVLAFVRGTLNRPSWASIWAVLESGNPFGSVPLVIERFSPENVGAPLESPLPWPIIHVAFAGLYLFIYTRRIDWRDPIRSVALAGMTVNLFLLWSRGFSGQFTDYAFPFVILLMPNLRGVQYAGLLGVLWIAEWPTPIILFPPEGNVPKLDWFMMWMIIIRTAILIALCLEYARFLFPPLTARLSRIAAGIAVAGWISVVPAAAVLIGSYAQTWLAADPSAPAVHLIRDSDTDANKTIVFAHTRIFRRLYPLARSAGNAMLLPLAKHVPEDVRLTWLDDVTARGRFWFIADESDPETLGANREAEEWLSEHACKVDTQVAGSARVSRFIGAPGEIGRAGAFDEVDAAFADEIALLTYNLSQPELRPGEELCVELNWQALRAPTAGYTVFVHVIDSQGRLVAQNDLQPVGGFAPTSGWATGSTIVDRHGILLPADLSPGEYVLRVGLYRSDDLSPVPFMQDGAPSTDTSGMTLTPITLASTLPAPERPQ